MIEPLESRTLFASGAGLRATYFDNPNFTGHSVSRIDAHISFNWGAGSPDATIAADTFAARWTGQLQPRFTETYTLRIVSDDGVRLWINHRLLIDTWTLQSGVASNAKHIALVAGRLYDIQLEYLEKTGSAMCRLLWSSPSQPESTPSTACLFAGEQTLRDKVDHAVAFARSQVTRTIRDLDARYDQYPSITKSDGTWTLLGATDWTAGFWAGNLWQMYTQTGDASLRLAAEPFTRSLQAVKSAQDDTGFRFVPSYLPLYRAHHNATDKQVLIDVAAAKVATYNATVGMFESINHKNPDTTDPRANFPVLMDHTMDLELVFEAARLAGRSDWTDKAIHHLEVLLHTMVRSDGSTVQWGYFDRATGDFIAAETRQGLSGATTWSRGQTWGMYSFVTAYAETRRSDFLATAKKLCNYYVAHVPRDNYVPYWDFDAPVTSTTPRDSSAAAVGASALLKFASLLPANDPETARYTNIARRTLATLCSPSYLAEGRASRGILLHGAKSVPAGVTDNSLIYGDYFFLETINRYTGRA